MVLVCLSSRGQETMGEISCRTIFTPALLLALTVLSINADAGWFGYDSYEECFTSERQERMERWINRMNAFDASVAARDACRKYIKPHAPDPAEIKATQERQQREAQAREEKMRNFRGPCTYEAQVAGYCTYQQYLDKKAQESIEAERERKQQELRSQMELFESQRRAEERQKQLDSEIDRVRRELYNRRDLYKTR